MIDAILIFDLFGFYSFFVVSGIIFFTFYRRVALLFVYFIGFLVNFYTNHWLKTWIQDPRPENPIPMLSVDDPKMYVGAEKYGFPSGHAQLVFYAITFLYYANKKITRSWIVCLFIGLLTIYQRLKYRRHTMEQLLAGTLIGIITGWITMTVYTILERTGYTIAGQ
jgi:membrane-associated phospholipid phosphatase